jgi:Ribbon-helix-helix protein
MIEVLNPERMTSQKPRLLVIIDSDLKSEFERLCEIEDRSMSKMVVNLIRQAVNKAKSEGKLVDG